MTLLSDGSTRVLPNGPETEWLLLEPQPLPALGPNTIVVVVGNTAIEQVVSVLDKLVFGRIHPSNPCQPDIDLTPYGGTRQGVSRLHASLMQTSLGWSLTDLGSSNGTWLNRIRLAPHIAYSLQSINNQVELGNLYLMVILPSDSMVMRS